MDGEAGWWTTSGNIGLPPLARAMGVVRHNNNNNKGNVGRKGNGGEEGQWRGGSAMEGMNKNGGDEGELRG